MTARDETRSAASAAGWAQAKGIDPWTDVFTRDAGHTGLQAKMLTAANVSWQAQDRIVVHYTESSRCPRPSCRARGSRRR